MFSSVTISCVCVAADPFSAAATVLLMTRVCFCPNSLFLYTTIQQMSKMRRTASIVSNMTSQSVKEEEAPADVEEAASVGLCGVMRSGEAVFCLRPGPVVS